MAVPKKPLLVESNGMGVAEEALKVGTGVGVTLGVTLRLSFENRLPKKEFPKKEIKKNRYFVFFFRSSIECFHFSDLPSTDTITMIEVIANLIDGIIFPEIRNEKDYLLPYYKVKGFVHKD